MSLEGKTEDQIETLETELLDKIKTIGSPAGNVSLIRELGWDDENLYWSVRDRLVDSGRLELGRGRGGSVKLVEQVDAALPPADAGEAVPVVAVAEAELYEPMANIIKSHWIPDNRFRNSVVEITAKQGRRETGGKWTRPLSLIHISEPTRPY